MADRRTVDELTIEELEQLLIVKRREVRADRMRRLAEIGRLPAEAALPHEDLAPIDPLPTTAGDEDIDPVLQAGTDQQRSYDLEPQGRGKQRKDKRR